jgi:hypothetical protein
MICAEALFIKRGGTRSAQKNRQIANAAELLLADDPALAAEPEQVTRFVEGTYRIRNAEIHGEPLKGISMKRLNGTTTERLDFIAEDLERVMRRAVQLILG